jgi:hypothetical protein
VLGRGEREREETSVSLCRPAPLPLCDQSVPRVCLVPRTARARVHYAPPRSPPPSRSPHHRLPHSLDASPRIHNVSFGELLMRARKNNLLALSCAHMRLTRVVCAAPAFKVEQSSAWERREREETLVSLCPLRPPHPPLNNQTVPPACTSPRAWLTQRPPRVHSPHPTLQPAARARHAPLCCGCGKEHTACPLV